MARRREAEKTAFFVAVLASGPDTMAMAEEALAGSFGAVVDRFDPARFASSDYYAEELGPEPYRAFFGFGTDFPPDRLAERKILTNRLEADLAERAGLPLPRPVNLDPGYLTLAKVVLASAKDFSHRVYLRDGIYAEVTLQYRGGGFHSLPWTFPDYASGRYDAFFLKLRERLFRRWRQKIEGGLPTEFL